MRVRKLFGLLIALAVLLAPSVAAAAERGMSMADHETQMVMEMGHCDAPPSGHSDEDKSAAHNCCISMCMGVAVTPATPDVEQLLPQSAAAFVPPPSLLGYLGEIATPPPRLA